MKVWDYKHERYINVYSVKESKDKSFYEVMYCENGKTYRFKKDRLKIDSKYLNKQNEPRKLNVYSYDLNCWRCGNNISLKTYIVYKKYPTKNLILPLTNKGWEKYQLFEDIMQHMMDSGIEFYSINILGDIPEYDEVLQNKYPESIQNQYSKTVKDTYPMNICPKCKAKIGKFFLYQQANILIQSEEGIEKIEEIFL